MAFENPTVVAQVLELRYGEVRKIARLLGDFQKSLEDDVLNKLSGHGNAGQHLIKTSRSSNAIIAVRYNLLHHSI